MSSIAIAALALAGLIVGAALGWLMGAALARSRSATALATVEANRAAAESSSIQLRAELTIARAQESQLRTQLAEVSTRLETERAGIAEQRALLDSAQEKLRDAFQSLSAQALRANNSAFLDLANSELEKRQQAATAALEEKQTAFTATVEPVATTLKELNERVLGLSERESDLLRETRSLSNALSQVPVAGRWGEKQLENIASLAGMLEYCDFNLQVDSKGADGNRQRLDMVVRLPNERSIIVDSKVPLTAYNEACAAQDAALRQSKLTECGRQVRAQITLLAAKSYAANFRGSADFVVCFLPLESLFSAALAADASLIEFAAEKHVFLASPCSLIIMLRAVALGWQEQKMAANARDVSHLAQDLYNRLVTCSGHIDKLRRSLTGSVDAYNKLVGSLERSVLPNARKFRNLGAGGNSPLVELEQIEDSTRLLQAADWDTHASSDDPDLPS